MKRNSYNTVSLGALILGAFFMALPTAFVDADAWWGKGYRSPEWVLSHGGTVIRSQTVGSKANNYKGILRKDGKYVEVEFGKRMVFDDAKDGTYTISYYNCNKDCNYQKTDNKKKIRGNDSLKDTITVVARPGQTVYIEFNTETKKARITGSGGKPVVQLTPEQLATRAAVRDEGKTQQLTNFHPSYVRALAASGEAQALPAQVWN